MATLLRVGGNQQGRDFVVGDVHGHLKQLRRQLTELSFDPGSDRLFFLGDIIDRGPDSEAVLAMIDQHTYWSVLGNHEAMMIAGFEEPGRDVLHRWNGGEWFYALPQRRQQELVEQCRAWPWAIELDAGQSCIGFVHANVPDNSWGRVTELLKSIDDNWQSGVLLSDSAVEYAAQRLLWDRDLVLRLYSEILEPRRSIRKLADYIRAPRYQDRIARASAETLRPFQIDGIDAVYMGHTFVPTAMQVGNCHFLDSYREAQGEQLSIVCVSWT
ncbi:Calcineurin-like phosphoesterase [Microbulbifer donghaiensis]|uniref:Calcineurin-like phosphoesterase n=1 Tax=Microbulbifer donghaiensis TaxID=494016 RepID=A0A1M4XHK5_9GAMM|nr:metallophosphoesterase [Microbulbifer donghaiensis]SHE92888.1 Calcineurin-like phosphoesterase [Microbulbifer donghaiensis]